MTSASTVLSIARKYMGTVGNGTGNHAHILSVYNNHKPLARSYKVKANDNWCDTFVSFVMIEAGATALTGTECGVERHVAIFSQLGIWNENGAMAPKPGDIIVYNWDDSSQPNNGFADHIGFVEKVSGGMITTIEGNKHNVVARRTIPVGYGYIRGYARPKYGSATASKPKPVKEDETIVETTGNVVTIAHIPGVEINVYDANGKKTRAKGYTNGTKHVSKDIYLLSSGPVFWDGKYMIPMSYTHYAHAIIINYAKGYGVLAVDKNGKQIAKTNAKFKTGTAWSWSKCVRIGKENFFQVSSTEFIPAKYVQGGGYK